MLYELADGWRPYTANLRQRQCGRARINQSIELMRRPDGAHFVGVLRCRSKSCPTCIAVRRAKAADEISRVAELAAAAGHFVYMATFTIRHGARMTLEKTGHGIRRAWGRFTSGRAWVNFKAKHSPEWIVCEEITHGANGWHPHLHVLFVLPKRASVDELIELRSEMYERWADLVVQEMGEACAPLPGPGLDFRPCNDPDYLQKLGLELSNLGTKTGNGRTPLELLAAWLESPPDPITGELDMSRREFELYQEFERTMKGKRDLTWSRGLKALREEAKQQIKDEQKSTTELVADVPPAVWTQVCEQRGARVEMLESAERLGFAGVIDWVTRNFGDDSAAAVRQWTALERQRRPQRSENAP